MNELSHSVFTRAVFARAGALIRQRRSGASAGRLEVDIDDIPVLTDSLSAAPDMVAELSRRIEARLAKTLPQLIDSTVREYLAEQASRNGQRPA